MLTGSIEKNRRLRSVETVCIREKCLLNMLLYPQVKYVLKNDSFYFLESPSPPQPASKDESLSIEETKYGCFYFFINS